MPCPKGLASDGRGSQSQELLCYREALSVARPTNYMRHVTLPKDKYTIYWEHSPSLRVTRLEKETTLRDLSSISHPHINQSAHNNL